MTKELIDHGMVKTFDSFKGFGFITREKGKDVFFFYEEIISEDKYLCAGDLVSFTVQQLPRGPRAFNIKKEA
ncbi:retron Se72 family effector protein [Yersinia enterocolitica]|uniref:retron Se72 family effector protein n=1 Tax=Yersinia TaxID=629 RepID=UPI001D109C5C